MENITKQNDNINIKKLFITVLAVYILLMVLFFFLAGDQLKFRESRGNIALPDADAAVAELTTDTVIEQTFTANIQRLEIISVKWTNYYRDNAGNITMQLMDAASGTVYMQTEAQADSFEDGHILTMSAAEPIESVYGVPLTIRITANSEAGSAVAPLKSASVLSDGWNLAVNGEKVNGTLCFCVQGTDYIWTGLHYWQFVGVGAILIIAGMLCVFYRYKSGKRSYLINALVALKKYKFLINQLVSRDFKTKYKRSVLGVFWSFLNPLLMMIVQYIVFSTIFRFDIENYPVYLLIGIVSFNFFSEVCGMSLTSILGNANLITKVYLPKYIYPLTRTMSSSVNMAISLLPLILMCLITGVHFHKVAPLALYFICCLAIFSLGLGLLLSASMVFFRDTQYLWNVISMAWMYATPIFYPASILPGSVKFLLTVNPLYHFIDGMRTCILGGISPEPIVYVDNALIALAMLALGAFIFKKSQNKFVLYL